MYTVVPFFLERHEYVLYRSMGIGLLYKIKNLQNIKLEKKKNPVRPRAMQLFLIVKRILAPRPPPKKIDHKTPQTRTGSQAHKPKQHHQPRNQQTYPSSSSHLRTPACSIIYHGDEGINRTSLVNRFEASQLRFRLLQDVCQRYCSICRSYRVEDCQNRGDPRSDVFS